MNEPHSILQGNDKRGSHQPRNSRKRQNRTLCILKTQENNNPVNRLLDIIEFSILKSFSYWDSLINKYRKYFKNIKI